MKVLYPSKQNNNVITSSIKQNMKTVVTSEFISSETYFRVFSDPVPQDSQYSHGGHVRVR